LVAAAVVGLGVAVAVGLGVAAVVGLGVAAVAMAYTVQHHATTTCSCTCARHT
jgi:hypothetical protein